MIERIARFGPDRRIVGITCEPRGTEAKGPVFVLLNAGILHRVGPNRMNVEFARALAAAGVRSLRFDLSGQGDSAPRDQSDKNDDSELADVKDALEFLTTKWSAGQFVLLGLCSGAFLSHQVATFDDRVVGAVFLDGYGYPTVGYKLKAPVKLAANPRRLGNIAKRVVRGLTEGGSSPSLEKEIDDALPVFDDPFPPLEQIKQELEVMLEAKKRLFFVYSGGVADYFNHREQFYEMYGDLGSKGDVELEYYEKADHLYYWTPGRKQLVNRIVAWATERFVLQSAA